MDPTSRSDAGYSRRGVLRIAAGATAGVGAAVATTARARPATAEPTVLTQNCYLGFDVSRLLSADSLGGFRRIVGRFVDRVDPAVYAARADAVAAAVADADADVVALQEATRFRTQTPGDFGTRGAEAADDVLVDLLEEVEAALDARGLDFRRAAVTRTSDAELPAETADGRLDFRVTDRNAVLVRDGVDVRGRVRRTFDTDLAVAIPNTDEEVSLRRGYARADLAMEGVTFAAVSTHLEAVSSFMRVLQARELLRELPGDRPVVLAGDLNSGPRGESAAYDLLTEEFVDPFGRLSTDGSGATCCQSPTLRNDRSALSRRIDAVLRRGDIRATAIERVNHRAADRIRIAREGTDDGTGDGTDAGDGDGADGEQLWPSDHAGVVATFETPG
ncbi:endonuclease/exonuclease/phosphatase family protein [Halobaculum lipolyticum]|uniref:Endonuclease/exonuclease/phosphatase family protein n=1 Tax=Halobaculum lipolyticum TaxID=3032001 RepID=A0ABD5WDL5_9EURY|nr:endonuclease/exonuclease/phosphatase family protein [Halobaculum sp. DT31]